MRRLVVMLVEEGPQTDIDVVERAQAGPGGRGSSSRAVCARSAPSCRAPAGRIRAGVQERDADVRAARGAQRCRRGKWSHCRGTGRRVRRVGAGRAGQEPEHVDLALGVVRLERDDVAGGVIEQPVDAHRLARAAQRDRRPVADVALPQGAGALGLPAQPRLGAGAVAQGDAVEPAPPTYRRRTVAGGDRRPGRAGRRGSACAGSAAPTPGMLAADVEQQLPLLLPSADARVRDPRVVAGAALRQTAAPVSAGTTSPTWGSRSPG